MAELFENPSRARDMCVLVHTRNNDADPPRHIALVAAVRSAAARDHRLRLALSVPMLDDDLPIEYLEVAEQGVATLVCGDDISSMRLHANVVFARNRSDLDWFGFAHTYLSCEMRTALAGVTQHIRPQCLIGRRLPGAHGRFTANGFSVDRDAHVRIWTTPRVNQEDPDQPLVI